MSYIEEEYYDKECKCTVTYRGLNRVIQFDNGITVEGCLVAEMTHGSNVFATLGDMNFITNAYKPTVRLREKMIRIAKNNVELIPWGPSMNMAMTYTKPGSNVNETTRQAYSYYNHALKSIMLKEMRTRIEKNLTVKFAKDVIKAPIGSPIIWLNNKIIKAAEMSIYDSTVHAIRIINDGSHSDLLVFIADYHNGYDPVILNSADLLAHLSVNKYKRMASIFEGYKTPRYLEHTMVLWHDDNLRICSHLLADSIRRMNSSYEVSVKQYNIQQNSNSIEARLVVEVSDDSITRHINVEMSNDIDASNSLSVPLLSTSNGIRVMSQEAEEYICLDTLVHDQEDLDEILRAL